MSRLPDSPVADQVAGSGSPIMDRSFILLRFTLIIATSYLLIAEFGSRSVPAPLMVLLVVVILSNVCALGLPVRVLHSPWLIAVTVVVDTAWITIALLATGRFTSEFFYLYFFVLFLAGVGENIRLIALGVAVVCFAYVVLVARTGGVDEVVTTQTLIRLPFLFSVAIFYGYLVDRLRRERHRVSKEQAIIESLERNRRALAAANEELRRQSDIKSKFVSTVSHELKSPLTAIKNATSLIDPVAEPEANARFLQMIRRNADRLQLIVSDLLDMAKAESGSLTISPGPVRLQSFLAEIVDPFGPQAAASGVELSVDGVDGELEAFADAARIEQVVVNLVSNAIKATPEGGAVTVSAEAAGDHGVTVAVSDTGVGLETTDQVKIFEPFYQAGGTADDKPKGTGLGLTICRDLIRGHGSELEVESEPGAGSRFFFALPRPSERATETIAFENQVRSSFRAHPYFSILVVECGDPAQAARPARTSGRFDAVADMVDRLLPRSLDVVCRQPAHDRVIAVLLSTPLASAWVVRRKLAAAIASSFKDPRSSSATPPRVLGPAGYPEDGDHGGALISRAMTRDETIQEEA